MHYLGVPTSRAMYLVDFATLAYFNAFFLLFQRNDRLAIIPFVSVTSLLYSAATYKYLLLGAWIRFADVSLLDEAWQVLPLAYRLTLVFGSTLALGITLYNIRWPRLRHVGAFLAPIAVCGTLMYSFPGTVVHLLRNTTHALYGNDPLYRSVSFAIGFDLLERWQFDRESPLWLSRYPAGDGSTFPTNGIRHARNIHIFVLESFMDPTLLGVPLTQDPIDPRIRGSIGGSSLSPVFAGRSAQAEFELLCGTPAYDLLDPVTFNDLRGEPILCLPTYLQQNGYATLASVDTQPTFFNAREAHKSLGFSRSYFRDDLPTTYMDGNWVSADQQISFNKDHIQRLLADKQPFLNYIFFTTGHSPYDLNPVKRPLVIHTPSTDEVTRFVNTVYYNTRSVAQYLDFLSKVDPTAIIIVVGDHQGVLLSIRRTHSGEHSVDRYRTPYVFLDAGEAQSFGDISQYQMPNLITASLSGTPYVPLARSYGVDMIRPFNDHAYYQHDGEVHRCPDATDTRCGAVDRFRNETIAHWFRLIEQSHPTANER